jgi:N-methylhydantoinase A
MDCFFRGSKTRAAVYERVKLRAGEEFAGPAIIQEYSATSLVPSGWRARVDHYGQLHLRKLKNTARRHDR